MKDFPKRTKYKRPVKYKRWSLSLFEMEIKIKRCRTSPLRQKICFPSMLCGGEHPHTLVGVQSANGQDPPKWKTHPPSQAGSWRRTSVITEVLVMTKSRYTSTAHQHGPFKSNTILRSCCKEQTFKIAQLREKSKVKTMCGMLLF